MQTLLETSRLIIRELLPTDEQGMFELDSDPDVHLYLGNSPVKNIEEIREVIQFIRQQYIDNGIGRWALVEKETNNFIGWVGLKLIRDTVNGRSNYYDLGYRIMKKHWGKGYTTEAAIACLDYGFNQLNQAAIYAMADVNNVSSQKVLAKVGFKCLETFTHNGEAHFWFEVKRMK